MRRGMVCCAVMRVLRGDAAWYVAAWCDGTWDDVRGRGVTHGTGMGLV